MNWCKQVRGIKTKSCKTNRRKTRTCVYCEPYVVFLCLYWVILLRAMIFVIVRCRPRPQNWVTWTECKSKLVPCFGHSVSQFRSVYPHLPLHSPVPN